MMSRQAVALFPAAPTPPGTGAASGLITGIIAGTICGMGSAPAAPGAPVVSTSIGPRSDAVGDTDGGCGTKLFSAAGAVVPSMALTERRKQKHERLLRVIQHWAHQIPSNSARQTQCAKLRSICAYGPMCTLPYIVNQSNAECNELQTLIRILRKPKQCETKLNSQAK